MNRVPFNNRSGLSLLELLVALAIMAVIATGLSRSLGLGVRVWESSQSIQEREEPLILRSQLRDWLEQALPPNRLVPFDNSFIGTTTGFSFLTLAETPFAANTAALRIEVTSADRLLILRVSYLDDMEIVIRSEERILTHFETPPEFSFYSTEADKEGWQSSWDSELLLPELVKIEFPTFVPQWPEFTVAPLLH